MATSVSPFTDSLHKAKHISDNTNFLGVRITELFKIKKLKSIAMMMLF